ncbi:unnamed protein product [Cyclocybe aegerita]|uniref:Uncharacterized protein n=1 Tax=Cyclocybe aegerita TaxID=1973307 RepID=A0A8S0W4T2_CYCAE|nr:unnamed protein product [Cyclocybe aegerita]
MAGKTCSTAHHTDRMAGRAEHQPGHEDSDLGGGDEARGKAAYVPRGRSPRPIYCVLVDGVNVPARPRRYIPTRGRHRPMNHELRPGDRRGSQPNIVEGLHAFLRSTSAASALISCSTRQQTPATGIWVAIAGGYQREWFKLRLDVQGRAYTALCSPPYSSSSTLAASFVSAVDESADAGWLEGGSAKFEPSNTGATLLVNREEGAGVRRGDHEHKNVAAVGDGISKTLSRIRNSDSVQVAGKGEESANIRIIAGNSISSEFEGKCLATSHMPGHDAYSSLLLCFGVPGSSRLLKTDILGDDVRIVRIPGVWFNSFEQL